MEMVYTWENVILVSVMAKEYIYSRMGLATKEVGSKEKEKAGEFINMPMEASTLVNIELVSGRALACMNITIKRLIKEVGRKIKRMGMESQY
jgi:hypothetical protein